MTYALAKAWLAMHNDRPDLISYDLEADNIVCIHIRIQIGVAQALMAMAEQKQLVGDSGGAAAAREAADEAIEEARRSIKQLSAGKRASVVRELEGLERASAKGA